MSKDLSTLMKDLREVDQFAIKQEDRINWTLPTVQNILACFCAGCKLIFPLVASLQALEEATHAQRVTILEGCFIHNSKILGLD